MTPLGVANDRIRQIGGRYSDNTNFDFMSRMGIWTENLSLPAVTNECLMQSHDGVIRLFPNTTHLGKARFRDLRAAGAVLVSAAWDGSAVSDVTLKTEKSRPVRVANPWAGRAVTVREIASDAAVKSTERGGVLEFQARAAKIYALAR
jgi:hypothetical protein